MSKERYPACQRAAAVLYTRSGSAAKGSGYPAARATVLHVASLCACGPLFDSAYICCCRFCTAAVLATVSAAMSTADRLEPRAYCRTFPESPRKDTEAEPVEGTVVEDAAGVIAKPSLRGANF